jgi:hypothetical protein
VGFGSFSRAVSNCLVKDVWSYLSVKKGGAEVILEKTLAFLNEPSGRSPPKQDLHLGA